MDSIFSTLLFLVAIFALVKYLLWQEQRSRELLDGWAARCGYAIMQRQRLLWPPRAYMFRSSRGQTLYRLLVRVPDGSLRPATARCGSYMLGLWQDQLDVRWEDTGLSAN